MKVAWMERIEMGGLLAWWRSTLWPAPRMRLRSRMASEVAPFLAAADVVAGWASRLAAKVGAGWCRRWLAARRMLLRLTCRCRPTGRGWGKREASMVMESIDGRRDFRDGISNVVNVAEDLSFFFFATVGVQRRATLGVSSSFFCCRCCGCKSR